MLYDIRVPVPTVSGSPQELEFTTDLKLLLTLRSVSSMPPTWSSCQHVVGYTMTVLMISSQLPLMRSIYVVDRQGKNTSTVWNRQWH